MACTVLSYAYYVFQRATINQKIPFGPGNSTPQSSDSGGVKPSEVQNLSTEIGAQARHTASDEQFIPMRNLLGWLGTRLAQICSITLKYIKLP